MSKLLWLLEYPTINGGERSLAATVPWIRAAGLDVSAVVPAPSAAATLLESVGVRVVPSPLNASGGNDRMSLDERRARLGELLTAQSPDLVVANSLSMARLAGPVTSELGIAAGGHLRDIVRLSPAAVADINRLNRLWAVSRAAFDYHAAQGFAANRLRVAYNGVDLEAFRPRPSSGRLSRELRLPAGTPIIGVIGQLVQRKGIDVALAAFLEVVVDRPDWHLVVIGERYSQKDEAREFEAELYRRRDQSGVADRIHFLGWRDDVGELLNEFSLLVHAPRQEPLGRVLLEAAACGVPIVAADVGGTREIFASDSFKTLTESPSGATAGLPSSAVVARALLDELAVAPKPGFETAASGEEASESITACELFPSGDTLALALAIRRLTVDAAQRVALGAAARARVQQAFDIRQRGPAIAAEYRDVLAGARPIENRASICYNNER